MSLINISNKSKNIDIFLNKNYYSKAVCYSEKMATATKKMININHKQNMKR